MEKPDSTTSFPSTPGLEQPATNVRWIVLGIVAFASASAYLTRHCVAAANTTIQRDLGIDDTQMGLVLSAFSFGYLLGQIPGGWLGNRFGTRFAFGFISTIWSLCNVCSAAVTGEVTSWAVRGAELYNSMRSFRMLQFLQVASVETLPMAASRSALGFFQGGLAPLSAKILKDWIPLQHRGKSSACIAASMAVGGAFTLWLTGWLLDHDCGWRSIFNAYSVVGIVWAVGFWWFFRTRPNDHDGVNTAELNLIQHTDRRLTERSTPAAERQTFHDLQEKDPRELESKQATTPALAFKLFANPSMCFLCVQSFFRAAGFAFFVTWFFAYLEYAYGVDKAQAGFLNSLPLIAVVVGSLAGGVIVDGLLHLTGSKWISRSGTAMVSLTLCATLTMVSVWTSSATQLAMVIAVGALFSGIANPAVWAATIDIGGRHTALVMAIMNMTGCVAGVALPLLLGSWFHAIRETEGDWDQVIYLHAAFYFAAAVSWVLVNPNRVVLDE